MASHTNVALNRLQREAITDARDALCAHGNDRLPEDVQEILNEGNTVTHGKVVHAACVLLKWVLTLLNRDKEVLKDA